jgi:DNA transformation protein
MKASTLSQLKNIGKTVETRLNEIGVYTKADLKQLGSVKAYQGYPKNNQENTCLFAFIFILWKVP